MRILHTAIVLSLVSATVTAAELTHPFTWDTLNSASIKLQPDYNYAANADSYMRVYQKDVWEFVRNDEFELETQRKKSIDRFRKQIDDFSLHQDMEIRTWVNIGTYNFETESFPVSDVDEDWNWWRSRYPAYSFPSTVRIFLSNHRLLSSIPMSPAEARSFLNRRKDNRGNVDRRLDVTLWIRILRIRPHSTADLVGEVQRAKIFDDRRRQTVLKDIIKPASAPDRDTETQSPLTPVPGEIRLPAVLIAEVPVFVSND